MTTKHEVIDLHTARPDITARQAADHLGCSRSYVTATCRRAGIKFALETKEQAYDRRALWLKKTPDWRGRHYEKETRVV